MTHSHGTLFDPGEDEPLAMENPIVLQGFVEGSNVNPVIEMARLIAVHRTYELAMEFVVYKEQRITNVSRSLA